MESGIKDDGWEQIYEEKILTEHQDPRVLSLGGKQNNHPSANPNEQSSDGLVHPPVLLQQVADDDAGAQQRREQAYGGRGGVLGGDGAEPHELLRQNRLHGGGGRALFKRGENLLVAKTRMVRADQRADVLRWRSFGLSMKPNFTTG